VVVVAIGACALVFKLARFVCIHAGLLELATGPIGALFSRVEERAVLLLTEREELALGLSVAWGLLLVALGLLL